MQVHGGGVVVVGQPGDRAGSEADAAVTDQLRAPLAVHTADCAPVALWSGEGVIAVVHAGWRGLIAGVVSNCCEEMRSCGAVDISAAVGPCISAPNYEFGAGDLEKVESLFGREVRASTVSGSPALDLRAAVASALARERVTLVYCSPVCTADSETHFSHRGRGDRARQATLVWLEKHGADTTEGLRA